MCGWKWEGGVDIFDEQRWVFRQQRQFYFASVVIIFYACNPCFKKKSPLKRELWNCNLKPQEPEENLFDARGTESSYPCCIGILLTSPFLDFLSAKVNDMSSVFCRIIIPFKYFFLTCLSCWNNCWIWFKYSTAYNDIIIVQISLAVGVVMKGRF